MLKIEKLAEGEITVLKLVGRICAQHLDELNELIAESKDAVMLDLGEVTLVDRDAIRFLENQESLGAQLTNCSRYIRKWIQREQQQTQTHRNETGG